MVFEAVNHKVQPVKVKCQLFSSEAERIKPGQCMRSMARTNRCRGSWFSPATWPTTYSDLTFLRSDSGGRRRDLCRRLSAFRL